MRPRSGITLAVALNLTGMEQPLALPGGTVLLSTHPGDPSPGRYGHTCDVVDLASFRDKRCLIVGGRQSAFEWTALLHEEGAASVDVCYRHDTPAFTHSDWSWFNRQVDQMVDNPGWFRTLSDEEKAAVNARFWTEGRLKLEPWLAARISHRSVHLWPHSQITACEQEPAGALRITLSNDETITVDHVIFATGYKVDMARIPLLAAGNLLLRLALDNGYPCLDEHFQTNIPGLFVTSMPAVQDFGLFFAFTISVRTSARLIGPAVQQRIATKASVDDRPMPSTATTPTRSRGCAVSRGSREHVMPTGSRVPTTVRSRRGGDLRATHARTTARQWLIRGQSSQRADLLPGPSATSRQPHSRPCQ